MRTINYAVGVAAVLLIVALSFIEPRREKGPPVYNAAAEVTVSGTVLETKEFFCPLSDDQGMHLVLRRPQGDVIVHVAPARFLRGQGIGFKANDQLKIVGSPADYQGQNALLAREITRGSEVFIVRDPQGRPLWIK
jgi:hypothetical protein